MVVLKELIFDTFYFGKVWWSWKNWFLMFSTSEGCCGLERTDFWHFLLWEGMVVLKELIFNVFYFRRVLWSWKNWFLTLSTLGRYGGLERTDFVFLIVSMLGGVVVLKELIFNSFYFGKDVVVLKELIFDTFYFGKVWWSWKNWFLMFSTSEGCCGLERTDF